ncbi:MAG: ABC transporter permease, partial [Eggerthellaceae bacterium]|nr:ABC transporter permease [Eggerthellaceae bacterium]
MRARDLAYETVAALDANRGRSILTVLGIVIGIAAVIAMTALIGGVRQSMIEQYGLSQARMVSMWCYYDREMTIEDVDALAKEMKAYYEAITPVTGTSETVVVGKVKKDAQINGVYAEYSEIQNLKFTQGRFFTKKEVEEEARVVVIEQSAVKTLFESPNAEVIGKTIHIGNDDFTVVGVIENTSSVGMDDWVTVCVPYTTCIKRLDAWSDVSQVYGLAREGYDMEDIAKYTERWFAHHFEVPEDERESSIYVLTMDSIIKQLDTMIGSFQALMLAVASVSLLVGGIGIMNMMLTNVTER